MNRRRQLCASLLIGCLAATSGCGVDTSPSRAAMPPGSVAVNRPGIGDDALDGGPPSEDAAAPRLDTAGPPAVHISAPMRGASFTRDTIEASAWVARVTFQVASSGVARVEMVAAGTSIGDVDASGALAYSFHGDGAIMVDAIGRDSGGTELARDTISINIAPPVDTGCHAMLDALGLHWTVGPPARGVADPVIVQPQIGGVAYRYETSASPTALMMDCRLAPRLVELSTLAARYHVVEIEHIGIYNYRCIGGGNPDTTSCTLSQHARAMAIDLHAFHRSDGSVYNVTTDFVITRQHDSCPMHSSSEPDRVLKEIACTLVADRTFQIVLTPNYNAAHRDHFHCDLTEGSMYLGTGAWGLDPVIEDLGD